MKKRSWILIAILMISGCATVNQFFGEPAFKVKGVVIENIDAEGVGFRADYLITNPYPVSVEVERIVMDVEYEGADVINIVADEGFTLVSSGAGNNSILFNLPYTSIINLAGDSIERESLPFVLDGVVSLNLSSVPYIDNQDLHIPFHYDFDVPVFSPRISVSGGEVLVPSVNKIASALAAGGTDIFKAGAAAGKLIIGEPVEGDVLESADLDIGILFDLRIENQGGVSWGFELDKCSIETGRGNLVVLQQNGTASMVDDGSVTLPLSVLINTIELGRFVSEIINEGLTDSAVSVTGKVTFPDLDYAVELPFSFSRRVSSGRFELSSE